MICPLDGDGKIFYIYCFFSLIPRISMKKTFNLSCLFLSVCLILDMTVLSQQPIANESTHQQFTTVIAGKEYKRSAWHRLFWGSHYRKEWTTPVKVKVVNLDTLAGGLTPVEQGGGRQTQTLRLKNPQGKQYVLRSIDKDFGKAFPEIFAGTFVARIAKDQVSFDYPYAAITVTPMIKAAKVYHTTPQIFFIPEQERLGSFNKTFGNQLYLFEERADDNQEDASNFGNSKNVIGSEKLYEHIYEDNDRHVDQEAFARARLFDMFIGDWGRHPDQWRWAQFDKGKQIIYRPIPRDRDQAYSKFDGFYPWIATNLFGAIFLESFDGHLNNVKRFNKPGLPLDRQFTNELTKKQWVDIAKELQQELTNSIIELGVSQLPPEIFAISGQTLIRKLKSRRDELADYANRYYDFLSHHVQLVGTNDRELFEINRLNNNETRVDIYKITKENEVKDKPYYSRIFKHSETKEIRIFSLEKTDVFKITGSTGRGTKIRIIDPQNADSVINISQAGHNRTKISAGKKFEFDTSQTKKFDFSILPLISPSAYKVFEDDPLTFFTKTGVRISANIHYIEQPWRKKEYEHDHVLSANYGFLKGAFNVGYIGRFGRSIGKWDLLLKARMDAPAVQNFFGIGNETTSVITTTGYYKTLSNRFYGGIGIERALEDHHFEFSIFYQNVKVKKTDEHFISENITIDSSVFSNKQFGGAEGGYHFQKTNDHILPTKGIDFSLGMMYAQDLKENTRSFTNLNSALSFYIPLGKSFSIGIRAGGGTIWGDADYYHLNRLSGNVNLRGFPNERFYGKSIFYNNNELRWVTNTRNFFFNGKIGLLAFYDDGRVWQPGEQSNVWHKGYGGGLMLVPFNKIVLVATYGVSTETTQLLLKAGLFF